MPPPGPCAERCQPGSTCLSCPMAGSTEAAQPGGGAGSAMQVLELHSLRLCSPWHLSAAWPVLGPSLLVASGL